MIRCTVKDRKGVSLIELLTVLVIISIIAAVARPLLRDVIVKARAAMQSATCSSFGWRVQLQTDEQSWPSESGGGVVPPGLEVYLRRTSTWVTSDYTLDFDNWGGSPFMVGVTLITPDTVLGTHGFGDAGFA